MHVTALRRYPVKSMGGLAYDEVVVEPQGVTGDRRWCLVDPAGEVVTARELHELLRLTAEHVDDDTLRITDRADGGSILVDTPLGHDPVPIGLSRLPEATPADPSVSEWISRRVGQPLRLVWQQDPTARPVSEHHGGRPGDVVSMAGTGPLLLASEASMDRLNAWIAEESSGEPLSVLRFRPNVVIDGDDPFVEDGWSRVRIGDMSFRTSELCDRCVMTTIDPDTIAGGKEPIRTLARHRRWDGKTWFGVRLVPLGTGRVAVGDPVTGG